MLARLTLATLLFACPALALAAPDAPAPSGRYEQDGAHTSVTWRIDHFGLSRYTARFVGAKARPAVMEVTFNGSMAEHPIEKIAKLGFSGHMRIKRSDWGLTFALPALGDEVDIAIETEFRPEATPPAAK